MIFKSIQHSLRRGFVLAAALFAVTTAAHGSGPLFYDEDTTPTLAELTGAPYLKGKSVRILLRYYGAYRITGEELAAAGVPLGDVAPSALSLWYRGEAVPIRVLAEHRERLAPGDRIEFIGDIARGTYSTHLPYNKHNVYYLCYDPDVQGIQYREETLTPGTDAARGAVFREHRRHERDQYFHFSLAPPGLTDDFYWFFYNAGLDAHQTLRVDFPGLVDLADEPLRFRVRVMGLTAAGGISPQHHFGMKYGEYELGEMKFDGILPYDFQTSMPATAAGTDNQFYFTTPAGRESAVDKIAMDFLDVTYPRRFDAGGRELFSFTGDFVTPAPPASVVLENAAPQSVVFERNGRRIFRPGNPASTEIAVAIDDRATSYVAVSDEAYLRPDEITLTVGAAGTAAIPDDTQALVVYHTNVARAGMAYEAYRRTTGLRIVGRDVRDIFDITNSGFISDVALKRFIRHAVAEAPGLKYLILFGDSNNDYREVNYGDHLDRIYEVLIPIHWIHNPATTWSGGYADDNWYGAIDAGNHPDLAIGRIPVNTDAEGFTYLRKVIEYEQFGKSRDDMALFVSSVERSFQDLVLQARDRLADHVSSTTVLFPALAEATEEVARMRRAIDEGVQLMYYVGHGGSMVWRVGPMDFNQQKDLFTPEEIGKLTNAKRYPIIACSSCYTTSFDFNLSIGEAFLLQPSGGAIAIIGSPWKSTVYEDHAFNSQFFQHYINPNMKRLGDVFLATKLAARPRNPSQIDMQTFTLLGDPCLLLMRYEP